MSDDVTTWVDRAEAEADLARDPPRGKLTLARVEAVCAAHATGVYLAHACQAASCSEDAWADWCRRRAWVAEAYGRAHAAGVAERLAALNALAGAREHLELLRAFDPKVFAPPKLAEAVPLQPAGPMVVIQIARGDITRALDGEVVEVTELVLPSSTTEESD